MCRLGIAPGWLIAAALAVVGWAAPATGAVVLGDDPSFGADSIIHDVDNDRDFLALRFTAPYSYDGVVAQLGPGGLFDGWHVASSAEMRGLRDAAGIVDGSSDAASVAAADELSGWFGDPSWLLPGYDAVRGLVAELAWKGHRFAYAIGTRTNVVPYEAAFRTIGYGLQTTTSEFTFLAREHVATPIPGTVVLLGSGLLGVAAARRRRRR